MIKRSVGGIVDYLADVAGETPATGAEKKIYIKNKAGNLASVTASKIIIKQ